jgi:mono/diheme cytochrome c family protein
MHMKLPLRGWVISLLVGIVLILAGCVAITPVQPGAAGGATSAPSEEATVAATEEMTGEATAEPAEEATITATEDMTGEATAKPTEEPVEEATAEPTEEATVTSTQEGSTSSNVQAGEYLVTISRGCGCHMNKDLGGFAGGAFAFKPGEGNSVYPANITPDKETGIGNWTPEQIAAAIRTGAKPDGTQLFPIMPYHAFSHLSDEDALNIAAYLLAQPPVSNAVPARVLATEPQPFTPDQTPPATAPTDPVARGEYLVQLARCSDCHTPKNEDGTPDTSLNLAGARISQDEVSSNLTPDDDTGIGTVTADDIALFLRTGQYSDGTKVAGTMETQIKNYFSKLTEDDAKAIAAYLKSLPSISNDPQ